MKIEYQPFDCCGMVAGKGLGLDSNGNYANEKRINQNFSDLKDVQYEEECRCAIIVLSSEQEREMEEATKAGFVIIQSFNNHKSGNTCHIMTCIYEGDFDY